MRTRGVIGRKIVAVRQTRIETTGGWSYSVDAIVLDDGTELRPHVMELLNGSDYGCDLIWASRKPGAGR